jgi:3'(2'), 5'-bisphosphate nucleotidase
MQYATERQLAIDALRRAAALCQAVRHSHQSTAIVKPDRSPVTIADYGAQALICQALTAAFPADPIVGEEDAQLLAQPAMADCLTGVTAIVQTQEPSASQADILHWIGRGKGSPGPRFWTLDPIDGTKGYVRGDQYAIALALIIDGQLQLGAMACPALAVDPSQPDGARGVIFIALRGQGAEQIPLAGGPSQRLTIDPQGPQRLIESVELDHGTPREQHGIAKAIGLLEPPIPMDSLAKYGAIARNEAALYLRLPSGKSLDRSENIWDHAAGVIVLEEAGGRVSDRHGKPLDFSRGSKLDGNVGIVASNGVDHDRIIRALQDSRS